MFSISNHLLNRHQGIKHLVRDCEGDPKSHHVWSIFYIPNSELHTLHTSFISNMNTAVSDYKEQTIICGNKRIMNYPKCMATKNQDIKSSENLEEEVAGKMCGHKSLRREKCVLIWTLKDGQFLVGREKKRSSSLQCITEQI